MRTNKIGILGYAAVGIALLTGLSGCGSRSGNKKPKDDTSTTTSTQFSNPAQTPGKTLEPGTPNDGGSGGGTGSNWVQGILGNYSGYLFSSRVGSLPLTAVVNTVTLSGNSYLNIELSIQTASGPLVVKAPLGYMGVTYLYPSNGYWFASAVFSDQRIAATPISIEFLSPVTSGGQGGVPTLKIQDCSTGKVLANGTCPYSLSTLSVVQFVKTN